MDGCIFTAPLWQAEHSAVRRTHLVGAPEPVFSVANKKAGVTPTSKI